MSLAPPMSRLLTPRELRVQRRESMQTIKAEMKDLMVRVGTREEFSELAREAANRYEECLVSEGLLPVRTLSTTGSSFSLGLPARHISAPASPHPTSPAPEKVRFMSERRISSSQVVIEIFPADDSNTDRRPDGENNTESAHITTTTAPNSSTNSSISNHRGGKSTDAVSSVGRAHDTHTQPSGWAERSSRPHQDANNLCGQQDVVLVLDSAALADQKKHQRQRSTSFWSSLTQKKLRPMETLVVLSSSATFSVPSTSRTMQEQKLQDEQRKRLQHEQQQQQQQQHGKLRKMRSRQFSASVAPEKDRDDASSPDGKRKPLMERARVGIRRMSNQFKSLVKRS